MIPNHHLTLRIHPEATTDNRRLPQTIRPVTPAGVPRRQSLDFELPPQLEAAEPPEARGLARDQVRLMVSFLADNQVNHTRFRDIENFLEPGDLLVINTSGTMNAAIGARRADGTPLELHLSTHLPADLWIVEVRLAGEDLVAGNSSGITGKKASRPFHDAVAGETFSLPGGAGNGTPFHATIHTPYLQDRTQPLPEGGGPNRLWIATLQLPCNYHNYLEEFGFPIRYGYIKQGWPNSYYQTVYATEMGSAEMPSAGRAFTSDLITRLVAKGVRIAPLILHTGVASLEEHEPPYEEYYRVPYETAQAVNTAKSEDRRVIAVGTTVVRALETVTDERGIAHPGEGWTRLVITPQRGLKVVDGLLTGFHEPQASHLAMIETLAGREHLQVTYTAALQRGYLWHEFGDLHLILPSRPKGANSDNTN
ncbi:MAG: S-adenosylmethionine:tRNA ribosyltransferase-isomerase [Chloroflexi bacterium]|nr:S-adenosylmethionine:tRNA ribosyltransferase-isomerase [Chloroflexota bacterium]